MLKKLLFISVGAGSLWLYLKYKQTKPVIDRGGGHEEVLFFPDSDFFCYEHFFVPTGCSSVPVQKCKFTHEVTNTCKLCRYILEAKSSIDICMFIFSSKDLMKALSTAIKEKHVKVRVLINATMAESEPEKIQQLQKIGAKIRLAITEKMFHHKFAIIDKKTSLSGSFNWTAQATLGNFDNVVVTSDQHITLPFVQEFEKLWKQFAQ